MYDWKYSFYGKCADILNTNCSATVKNNSNFYNKDYWNATAIINGRSCCYSSWEHKGLSSGICDICKDTLNKIDNFVANKLEEIQEYQEMIDSQEKFIDIAIDSLENELNSK